MAKRSRSKAKPHTAAPPGTTAVAARTAPAIVARAQLLLDVCAPWIVVGLGLALRFYRLDREPFWFDEAYTALSVQLPLTAILERLRGEGNAPLYYALMHAWTRWFGDSVFAMRFPSALVGSLTIPLMYWVASRLFSRRAALIAATLAAVSPLHIHYTQEARMYPLVPPFALLVLYGVYRLMQAPEWKAAAVLALAGTVGLYTQYYFLFLLPVAAAPLAAPQARRCRTLLLAAGLAMVAGFAPWVPTFLEQARNSSPDWIGTFWRQHSIWYAVPWSLQVLGPGGWYPPWATFKFASSATSGAISSGLSLLVCGGAGVEIVRHWRTPDDDAPAADHARALGLTLAAVLLPLGLAFVASLLRRPVYVVARYDLIAWGAYCVLAGAVVSCWRPPLAAAVVALWLALSVHTLWPYVTTDRPRRVFADQGDRIARQLLERALQNDAVVFTAATRTMTEYYLGEHRGRFQMSSYPLGTDEHLGWMDERIFTDPVFAAAEAKRFVAWFTRDGTVPQVVWVVAPRTRGAALLLAELKKRGYGEDSTSRRDVLLLRLLSTGAPPAR